MSRGREYKNKDWLYSQYIVHKKSSADIGDICRVGDWVIQDWLRKFNIPTRSRKEAAICCKEKTKKTCLQKYGVDHNWKSKKVQEKTSKTCQKKYGGPRPLCSKEIREKQKETMMEKYGVNHNFKKGLREDGCEKTCLKKYGTSSPFGSGKIRDKVKKTLLKKYGVDNIFRSKKIREEIRQTLLRKYGVSSPFNMEIVRRGTHSKATQQKRHETMKRNGSYGKSKSEDRYFEYLVENIDPLTERQVRHKGFNIDFYLPSWDVYIQFDGDYWHGYMDTKEQLEKSEQGKVILKTMRRDIIQNETISNLVRIREGEFLGNNG